MQKPAPSPHTHGRSEIWRRPALTAAIRRTCRHLGLRLRELRKERNLTIEVAAEKAGLHDKLLQRLETGVANVTVATLVAVTRAYSVDIEELFAPAAPARRRKRSAPLT